MSSDLVDFYTHTVWTMEDGLPQNTVTAMTQTEDGYLWLATFGGLARFDGLSFTVFDVAHTEGLASNRLTALYEDPDGALWIGHEGGALTQLKDGVFTSYTVEDGLPGGPVWSIVRDKENTLWVGAGEGLVPFFDGVFGRRATDDDAPLTAVFVLHVNREGNLWVGSNNGLSRFEKGSFEILGMDGRRPGEGVRALVENQHGTYLIGSNAGLTSYTRGQFEDTRGPGGVLTNILALRQDKQHNLWVGTRESLVHLEMEGGEIVSYAVYPTDAWVRSVFEDREGNVWVGISGKGLYRFRKRVLRRFTTADGLPHDAINRITSDGKGGLWMSPDCGSLTHFREGTFTTYRQDDEGSVLHCILALLTDRNGDLWLGRNDWLSHYKDGDFTTYKQDDGLTGDYVQALFEDQTGDLWIGTRQGLVQFDGNTFSTYTTEDGLGHDDIFFIMQSQDGALWMGTRGGVSRLDAGEFINYTSEDGLPNGTVRAIHEDEEGTFWFGTYGGGLARFKDGIFTRYTVQDGLYDNVISRILEDEQGNLWMLGNLGLFYASRQQLNDFAEGRIPALSCISFGVDEGMREGNGGGQPAGWQTADGRMWFPTIDGLVMIDAKHFRPNEIPPPVVIEDVTIDNRTYNLDAVIEAQPGPGDLEIRYAGLSFSAPEKVQFKYLLEGYDEDWIDAGARRAAFYTNIPPGSYKFRVKAANNDGLWNEDGAVLLFSLAPHFYETKWFIAILLLLVGLFLYAAYHARTQAMEMQRLALERRVEERTAELDVKNTELSAKNDELERFAYTVSHDLKSPLFTILGFSGLLKDDVTSGNRERAEEGIDMIQSAARKMQRLLDEILELSRIGRLANPSETIALTDLAQEAVDLVAGQIQERGVSVEVDPRLPTVEGDRVRLLQVFQNLIDNAVKFMGDQREPRVEIGTEIKPEGPSYYVRDNGMGIEPKYQNKVFGLFERLDATGQGTGVGLALVKRIVEVHGGRIWVESEGVGKGSTFYFTLQGNGALRGK